MARVKRGLVSHRRHKKLHELTKGYKGGRGKLVKEAKSALLHAGEYAFAGRKKSLRHRCAQLSATHCQHLPFFAVKAAFLQ